MAVTISTDAANAQVDALVEFIDTAGDAVLSLYSGSRPTSPEDAATGTLLCSITLNSPSFNAAADGVAQLNVTAAPHDVALASGTIGWYRIADADGVGVVDGELGDLTLSAASVVTGATVTLTGGTLHPDGWS